MGTSNNSRVLEFIYCFREIVKQVVTVGVGSKEEQNELTSKKS